MYSAKYDTEEGKDDHAGPTITFCAWSIEGWNVWGTGTDGTRCYDTKNGGENKWHEV